MCRIKCSEYKIKIYILLPDPDPSKHYNRIHIPIRTQIRTPNTSPAKSGSETGNLSKVRAGFRAKLYYVLLNLKGWFKIQIQDFRSNHEISILCLDLYLEAFWRNYFSY